MVLDGEPDRREGAAGSGGPGGGPHGGGSLAEGWPDGGEGRAPRSQSELPGHDLTPPPGTVRPDGPSPGELAEPEAEVDDDAPVTARSWSEVRMPGPQAGSGRGPEDTGNQHVPAARQDGASAERSGERAGPAPVPAEGLLQPRVIGRGEMPPPDGGSRSRLTPATAIALLLLLVSSMASLAFVVGRGGVALPTDLPTLPVAVASDASSDPSPGPASPGPSSLPSAPSSPAPTEPAVTPAPSQAPATLTPPQRFGEDDPAIAYEGTWGRARAADYAGGAVAWTTEAGASALLVFSGSTITWFGPSGPTRGSAVVYLDGAEVGTVSQYAASFTARRALFTHAFSSAGSHTIRIVASGTAGHPMVAIDELVVSH